jgi:hypothetical protein
LNFIFINNLVYENNQSLRNWITHFLIISMHGREGPCVFKLVAK